MVFCLRGSFLLLLRWVNTAPSFLQNACVYAIGRYHSGLIQRGISLQWTVVNAEMLVCSRCSCGHQAEHLFLNKISMCPHRQSSGDNGEEVLERTYEAGSRKKGCEMLSSGHEPASAVMIPQQQGLREMGLRKTGLLIHQTAANSSSGRGPCDPTSHCWTMGYLCILGKGQTSCSDVYPPTMFHSWSPRWPQLISMGHNRTQKDLKVREGLIGGGAVRAGRKVYDNRGGDQSLWYMYQIVRGQT